MISDAQNAGEVLNIPKNITQWSEMYGTHFANFAENEDSDFLEIPIEVVAEASESLRYLEKEAVSNWKNSGSSAENTVLFSFDFKSSQVVLDFYTYLIRKNYSGFLLPRFKDFLEGEFDPAGSIRFLFPTAIRHEESQVNLSEKERVYTNAIFEFLSNRISTDFSAEVSSNLEFSRDVDYSRNPKNPKYSNSREEYLISLVLNVAKIEALKSGGCRELNRLFGIRNFGIYPPEHLLKQLNDFPNSVSKAKVVNMSALGDYNFAFTTAPSVHQQKNFIKDTYKALFSKKDRAFIDVIYYEFGSPEEFLRHLLEINKIKAESSMVNGSFHNDKVIPLQLLNISAHGSRDSFNTNIPIYGKNYCVATNWLQKLVKGEEDSASYVSALFEEDSLIILDSCSTSMGLRNLANTMSETFKTNTIAPSQVYASDFSDRIELQKNVFYKTNSPVFKYKHYFSGSTSLLGKVARFTKLGKNKNSDETETEGKYKTYYGGVLMGKN